LLPPRDREKFWYTAIARAELGAAKAKASAEALGEALKGTGYEIGPGPG
jgi:hypothetical protein